MLVLGDHALDSLPDGMCVKSATGSNAFTTPSSMSTSCHVGTRWLAFLSLDRTLLITGSCSRMRCIILNLEPHRVSQSEIRECWGKLSSIWAAVRACFFLWLWAKWVVSFRHTPIARLTVRSSLILFVTARFSLCPKHWNLGIPASWQAFTMFAPLSVVNAISLDGSRFHLSRLSWSASFKFSLVWSCGVYNS